MNVPVTKQLAAEGSEEKLMSSPRKVRRKGSELLDNSEANDASQEQDLDVPESLGLNVEQVRGEKRPQEDKAVGDEEAKRAKMAAGSGAELGDDLFGPEDGGRPLPTLHTDSMEPADDDKAMEEELFGSADEDESTESKPALPVVTKTTEKAEKAQARKMKGAARLKAAKEKAAEKARVREEKAKKAEEQAAEKRADREKRKQEDQERKDAAKAAKQQAKEAAEKEKEEAAAKMAATREALAQMKSGATPATTAAASTTPASVPDATPTPMPVAKPTSVVATASDTTPGTAGTLRGDGIDLD